MTNPRTYPIEKAFPFFGEKTAVLIDGANLYATLNALNLHMDWTKLKDLLSSNGCHMVSMRYYTALHAQEGTTEIKIMPLLDFLAYNGYVMVTKNAKSIKRDDGTIKIKGDMDIEICCDALSIADTVDHIVLFTGDGDFCPLLRLLQMKGKRVTIISSIDSNPTMCADALRRQADCFVELATMADDVRKEVEN